MLEREEKLSAEEKVEAELLYEREKNGGSVVVNETYSNLGGHYGGNVHNYNGQNNPFKHTNQMINYE